MRQLPQTGHGMQWPHSGKLLQPGGTTTAEVDWCESAMFGWDGLGQRDAALSCVKGTRPNRHRVSLGVARSGLRSEHSCVV